MKRSSVLKWIYINCGKRWGETAALIVLNAWSAVCVTLFALLSKLVIDCAQKGSRDELIKYTALLLVLIISQMLARVVSAVIEAVSQGKAEKALKTYVFSSALYGNYGAVTERHSGDIMTRLTADVSVVSDNYVHILPSAVSYSVRILSAAAALLALDKYFAAVFICCGIAVVLLAALFRKPLKALHLRVQERDSSVRSFMQEMIENLFAVKVFSIEDKIIRRSEKLQNNLYRERVKKKTFSVGASIGFSVAFAAGFLAAVAYGADGILKGTMTFGTVAAIIQLVNQLQSPAAGLTGIMPSFFAMTASAQRLIETAEGEKEEICDTTSLSYDDFIRITAKDVTFGYAQDSVIENASFTVEKGEFIGIKGPSGAGKSTVFKLITGLYEPEKGVVTVETSKGEVECKKARSLFSAVPQGNMLFSGTVKENLLLLSPDADEKELEKAISDACAEFVYELDGGLDFELGEGGSGISEGQAQRIAVARALLGKGKILLMDESTGALDGETEKRLIENLHSRKDITVLFITHRDTVLEKCGRIITVSNGRISEN